LIIIKYITHLGTNEKPYIKEDFMIIVTL